MDDVVLKLEGVSKIYNNGVKAVDNCTFEIFQNDIVGLLGPNGAGKTTIIKMICGLTTPTTGQIFYKKNSSFKDMKNVSIVMEGNRNLYWKLTVKENIEFILGIMKIKYKNKITEINELLQRFNLHEKKNELVGKLSRGMQQKLSILIAVLIDSDIILMDEPTLGLDVESQIELVDILHNIKNESKKTILISSHDMRFIEQICNSAVVINKGKILLCDQISNIRELFNISIMDITIDKFNNNIFGDYDYNITILSDEEENKNIRIYIKNKNDINDILKILVSNQVNIYDIKVLELPLEDIFLEIIK